MRPIPLPVPPRHVTAACSLSSRRATDLTSSTAQFAAEEGVHGSYTAMPRGPEKRAGERRQKSPPAADARICPAQYRGGPARGRQKQTRMMRQKAKCLLCMSLAVVKHHPHNSRYFRLGKQHCRPQADFCSVLLDEHRIAQHKLPARLIIGRRALEPAIVAPCCSVYDHMVASVLQQSRTREPPGVPWISMSSLAHGLQSAPRHGNGRLDGGNRTNATVLNNDGCKSIARCTQRQAVKHKLCTCHSMLVQRYAPCEKKCEARQSEG